MTLPDPTPDTLPAMLPDNILQCDFIVVVVESLRIAYIDALLRLPMTPDISIDAPEDDEAICNNDPAELHVHQ